MEPLIDLGRLLSYWNLLLIIATWVVVGGLKKYTGDFFQSRLGRALLPVTPIVLCSVMVWVPGPWLPDGASIGERLVLGIVLGALAANAHVLLKRAGVYDLVKKAKP